MNIQIKKTATNIVTTPLSMDLKSAIASTISNYALIKAGFMQPFKTADEISMACDAVEGALFSHPYMIEPLDGVDSILFLGEDFAEVPDGVDPIKVVYIKNLVNSIIHNAAFDNFNTISKLDDSKKIIDTILGLIVDPLVFELVKITVESFLSEEYSRSINI